MWKINNKGQALIEFILIMPIFMFILFVIIDFSNVFYQKNKLESTINSVVEYKKNGKSKEYINSVIDDNVKIYYTSENGNTTISLSKKINLVTPFSNMLFEEPFTIKTKRVMFNE